MAKYFKNLLIFLLLVLPTTIVFVDQGNGGFLAFAQDAMEGEEDEATVETESTGDDDAEETDAVVSDKEEEAEEEDNTIKPSPDADTFILFTKPSNPLELPAGKQVRMLVGFTNKGSSDFVIESMAASFRYPQDYSYILQNFTTIPYSSVVEPKRQATFEYGFVPSDSISPTPFGLSVIISYKDAEGKVFQNAVFNETIQVVEPDEGLDGETFFLYVFLAAIVILLLVGAQQLLSTYGRKRLSKPRQPVEMGTQNSDVDYDWLPKETLMGMNKSPRRAPKQSPKQSPRQRRNLRSTGTREE